MTVLEKLRQWLMTFPQWDGNRMEIDYTDGVPGHTGLYPTGLQELRRREDVLGNITADCRYVFSLYRLTHGQQDNEENAQWLLALQDWVQAQSAAGLAPTFGDVPAGERLRAENGRLKSADQTGTAVYAVTLTAEFTKHY